MATGISETMAETTKDRIERVVGEAKDKAQLIPEFVTDSWEVTEAVDAALEALWKLELVAAEVIDRRTVANP